MSMDDPSTARIQAEASPILSVPAWFGEVALVAHALTRLGLLTTISERVRFTRKRFGTFEVIDFLVVLIGYALSGEPTLAAYYERLRRRGDCARPGRSPFPPDATQRLGVGHRRLYRASIWHWAPVGPPRGL